MRETQESFTPVGAVAFFVAMILRVRAGMAHDLRRVAQVEVIVWIGSRNARWR